jgi:hypothetical protein
MQPRRHARFTAENVGQERLLLTRGSYNVSMRHNLRPVEYPNLNYNRSNRIIQYVVLAHVTFVANCSNEEDQKH